MAIRELWALYPYLCDLRFAGCAPSAAASRQDRSHEPATPVEDLGSIDDCIAGDLSNGKTRFRGGFFHQTPDGATHFLVPSLTISSIVIIPVTAFNMSFRSPIIIPPAVLAEAILWALSGGTMSRARASPRIKAEETF